LPGDRQFIGCFDADSIPGFSHQEEEGNESGRPSQDWSGSKNSLGKVERISHSNRQSPGCTQEEAQAQS
jgi:hypothetical protein